MIKDIFDDDYMAIYRYAIIVVKDNDFRTIVTTSNDIDFMETYYDEHLEYFREYSDGIKEVMLYDYDKNAKLRSFNVETDVS